MNPRLLNSIQPEKLLLTVLLFIFSVIGFAQTGTVAGTVRDEKGQPVSGASVVVKGTTTGTSTNSEGKFSIAAPAGGTLQISIIGYEPHEVALNGRTTLDVVLTQSAQAMNNVVIAYGVSTRRTATGSVQAINARELQDIPVPQLSQKLQGRLAGVQILQTTGRPGEGMSVRIRGQASITAGNQPLYVVDGFPISGDINTLNPDEIESISVLKDAASTSLYGSRATNGVVIITTKRARSGQASIGVNAYYGVQRIPQKGRPDIMNAREFAQYAKEVYQENNRTVPAEYQNPEQYGEGTNWYEMLTQTAPVQNYSVTLNAARDKFSTSAVLGYFNQEGVIINTGFKRFSARLNSDYRFTDKLRLGLNIAPTFSIFTGRPTDGSPFPTNSTGGLIQNAIISSPLAPAVNPDGSLPLTATSPGMFPNPNWYRVAVEADAKTRMNRLLSTAFLEYEAIKGLTLKTSINAELGSSLFNYFSPSTSGGWNTAPPRPSGDLTVNKIDFHNWLSENLITYRKTIRDHSFDVLGGFTVQKYRGDISNITATNFANDRVRTLSAATTFNPSSEVQEWSLISYLARLNYNFKGRYLFSASLRRDGSSRFGSDNKWGNFPSVAAGWIVSDEAFMANVPVVSLLKLRSSYGETGNNNIGNYTYFANVSSVNSGSSNNYVFNNTLAPGNTVTTLANPTLGWEKTKQFDFGVDIGLWSNRLSFTYDYYTKTTSGLLFDVPVPTYTGFSTLTANIGELKFWGHEFTISSQNLTKKLIWNTDFNISFNRNRVEQLGTGNAALGGGTNRNITKVGQPIGMLWGYDFLGVYMNREDYDKSPKFMTSNVGTAKMRDVNGDGVITVDDRTIIGNPNPDFIFGITNSFAYKNFDLSIVASGSYGNDIMNTTLETLNNLDGVFNVMKDVANRWRSEQNPGNGRIPRVLSGTTGLFRNAHSGWVTDGSHLTIKNIALGYNVPLRNRNYLRSARLYGSMQQALVFTKYQGTNPEVNTGGTNPLQQGLDFTAYPVPRTFTIGVNLGL
ncbi:MAG: TonB-dependent receptor [Flavisolibacter sp.]|nr:TonB-dependent receptor [Flavisolibacter sp.]